jgi:hypothetical protein
MARIPGKFPTTTPTSPAIIQLHGECTANTRLCTLWAASDHWPDATDVLHANSNSEVIRSVLNTPASKNARIIIGLIDKEKEACHMKDVANQGYRLEKDDFLQLFLPDLQMWVAWRQQGERLFVLVILRTDIESWYRWCYKLLISKPLPPAPAHWKGALPVGFDDWSGAILAPAHSPLRRVAEKLRSEVGL